MFSNKPPISNVNSNFMPTPTNNSVLRPPPTITDGIHHIVSFPPNNVIPIWKISQ